MINQTYTIKLPENCNTTVFVNGIIAKNLKGWFWLMAHIFWIKRITKRFPGCVQLKAGICHVHEVVLVSYWKNDAVLSEFFRSSAHQKMMKYVYQHPKNLSLYNEIYRPTQSGKYLNDPHGLAFVFREDR